jgi:hypothetical protein
MKKVNEIGIHDGHVHAEILLIDHLLQNNTNKEKQSIAVEIGISTMPCLICSYYIDALNKHHGRYFCESNSTHEKIYLNWSYRDNEDELILNSINEELIKKTEHLIEKNVSTAIVMPRK